MGRGSAKHGPGLALMRWSEARYDDPQLRLHPLLRMRVRLLADLRTRAPQELRARRLEGQHLGERVAVAYLRDVVKDQDVKRMGGSSIPFDVLSREHAVEVKTGLSTNETNAQQWRCTFSAPKAFEQAKLAAMTAAEVVRYHEEKRAEIMRRKHAALQAVQQVMPVAPITLGLILDLLAKEVDVFWFEGWHLRIGWRSPEARAGFCGTYRVEEL